MRYLNAFGGRVLLTSATNLFVGLVGLMTATVGARLLGVAGRGELAAIQVWPDLICWIAMLGLPDALVYFSARDPDRAGRSLGSGLSLALMMSLVFAAVAWLAMPAVLARQSGAIVAGARWYLLMVPLWALVQLPLQPLRGRNDLLIWNALRVTPYLGWLTVLLLAYWLQQREASFVVGGFLAMVALLALPIMYVVTRRVPGPYRPDVRQIGPLVGYGLPCVASSIPHLLNVRLDQLFLAGVLPAQSLGLYMVATGWSSIATPLPYALGSVLFPRVAALGTHRRQTSAFAQGTRFGLLCCLVITAALLVSTPRLLPLLFGQQFAPAVPSAMVLGAAGGVAGFSMVLEEGLRGLGHPRAVMWSEFIGMAVTAGALLLLLGPLAILGAASASLLGRLATTVCLVRWSRRLTKKPWAKLLLVAPREVRSTWGQLRDMVAEAVAGRSHSDGPPIR